MSFLDIMKIFKICQQIALSYFSSKKAAEILEYPVYNYGLNAVEGFSLYKHRRIAIDYPGQLIEYAKDKNVKIAVYTCNWENFVIDSPPGTLYSPHCPNLALNSTVLTVSAEAVTIYRSCWTEATVSTTST